MTNHADVAVLGAASFLTAIEDNRRLTARVAELKAQASVKSSEIAELQVEMQTLEDELDAYKVMQKSEGVVRGVVRITLLLTEPKRRVEAEVRPEDVLTFCESQVSEEDLKEMMFGVVLEARENGDVMTVIDEKMEWTFGEEYILRGLRYRNHRSGPCSCRNEDKEQD